MLRPQFEYLAPKVMDEKISSSSKSDSDASEQFCSESDVEEEEHFDDSAEQSDNFDHQASTLDVEAEFRTEMFTRMKLWDGQRVTTISKFSRNS